jgi:hypothetical protein
MTTRVRAEVGGLGFESPHMHLFLPSKHLKINTFTLDSVVLVPKPGVKGLGTVTKGRFSTSDRLFRV